MAAVLSVLIASPALAQQDDVLNKRINDPAKDQFRIQGKEQKTSVAKSEGVPGGYALRVKVNTDGPNPWAVAAQAPVSGAIKKGDVVLLALWARVEEPAAGKQAGDFNVRIQQSAAPYAAVGETALQVGPDWKMYYVSGRSNLDLGPGLSAVAVHLAKARQTVELGPFTLLNFGPDYDMSKLPKN
jgi:hypothetical protein